MTKKKKIKNNISEIESCRTLGRYPVKWDSSAWATSKCIDIHTYKQILQYPVRHTYRLLWHFIIVVVDEWHLSSVDIKS